MLHKPEVRLIVQSKTSPYNKYYPQILTASVSYAYPFSVPTANIEIVTNRSPETAGYISPLRVDDIVRLQASVKFSRLEKTVWFDIFEGRIRDIDSPFGTKNTTTLNCVGHIYETTYSLIEETKFWSGEYDAMNMLNYLCNTANSAQGYLSRLTYAIDGRYVSSGIMLTDFNIEKDQKYMHDILADLEKISQHTFQTYTQTVYDSTGLLTAVYLCWKPFSNIVTTKYQIIEGTHRLLDADFESSTEDLWTSVRIYGNTYETSNGATPPVITQHQYSGISWDLDAIAAYGRRTYAETVTSLGSNAQCGQLATGYMMVSKDPQVVGKVKVFGTAYAKVGDFVHVKLPSIEINGASIDGNFRVVKVTHNIAQNTFTTDIEFGKLKTDVADYISKIHRKGRVSNCNHIKYHT
jgi:hypothetical protein